LNLRGLLPDCYLLRYNYH